MNIRTRRLARDFEKIIAELAGSEFVEVKVVAGEPPNSYRVTYHVNGLAWDEAAGNAVPVSEHVVDIYLPIGYPRQQPNCTMRTRVWHPNIGDYICIGDYWSAGVTLVDIIAHIGEMLQYKSYNLRSPVNKAAAAWAAGRTKSFPIGTRSILPSESDAIKPLVIERVADEVDIDLGPVRERK